MSRYKEPKEWEETLTPEEIKFIYDSFYKITESDEYDNADNIRAARIWKSSQRRRFFRQKRHGCCGEYDAIIKRWDEGKKRFDIYLFGFNYGH